jgi:hypothetical protein
MRGGAAPLGVTDCYQERPMICRYGILAYNDGGWQVGVRS